MAKVAGGRDVQTVNPRVASDPGLRVASGAFQGNGQALSDLGAIATDTAQRIDEAEDRIKSRQEAIDRAREEAEFNRELNDRRRALEDTEDMTDPEVMEQFGAEARQLKEERVLGHRGRPESSDRMNARMEAMLGQHIDAASTAAATASDKRVNDAIGSNVSSIAAQVGSGSLDYNSAVNMVEDTIGNFADGLRVGQESDIRRSAQSILGQSVIERMIRNGEVDAAEDFLLHQPGVAESLDEPARRRIRNSIHSARSPQAPQGAAKGRLAGEEAIAQFTAITGAAPNAQQALELAGTPNGDDDGGILGNSFNAKRLEAFANLAPSLADGTISPENKGILVAAAVDYTQPRIVPNADTGVPERVQRVLPPELAAAFKEQGMAVPGESAVPAAGAPPEARREALVGQLPKREQGQMGTTEQPPAQPAERPTEQPTAQSTEQPTGQKTIFEMAPLVAGPEAALGLPAGRLPLTGGLSPQMQQARVQVDFATRDLIRVLQNSPKFAQAERSAIEKEIDLGTKFFDSPEAFRQRLVGMDDALSLRQRNAIETATNENVGEDEREHALNIANGIAQFRESLLPPRLFNQEEFDAFVAENPPNTPFLVQDPSGEWILHATGNQ